MMRYFRSLLLPRPYLGSSFWKATGSTGRILPDVKATKILCITPISIEPVISQRIQMLREAGFDVEVITFENNYYPGQLLDHRVQSLGRLYFNIYWLRVFEIMARVPKIRAAIRRNDIVYVFHTGTTILPLLAGMGLAMPAVLEIHDIAKHQVDRNLKGQLVRFIDKGIITKKYNLLVLTTRNYHNYYRDILNVGTPTLIIENKCDRSFSVAIRRKGISPPGGKPFEERPLRIGYFGSIRDKWSLHLIELLTTTCKRFEIVIAGVTSPKIHRFDRFLERNPNVEYRGAYSSPEDLPELYGSVDMVLACYSPEIPFCWAQSNRYYQSCLFRKPMIARACTGDANEVNRHQIGLVIKDDNIEKAVNSIRAVTIEKLKLWQTNLAALSPAVSTHTNEGELLGSQLKKLVNK